MKASTSLAALAATLSSVCIAAPSMTHERIARAGYTPCTGLYSSAVCCDADVLGVVDLSCDPLAQEPSSAKDLTTQCAAKGKAPKCCVIPLLGVAVLCQKPTGVQ